MLNMLLKEKDSNNYTSFPVILNLQEFNLIQFKKMLENQFLWGMISYMLFALLEVCICQSLIICYKTHT